MMARRGSSGVVSSLFSASVPVRASYTAMSVNVPPTSAPAMVRVKRESL